MRVIYSRSSDVYQNLAAEDALLDDESVELPVIFVYRNDPAVVLGKNQNPWRECAAAKLSDLGVRPARRVTGGGTVFHDAGNINISLILSRESYNRCDVLHWVIKGLKQIGLDAGIVNDTSIVSGGHKISGNAFCYRRNRVLHHGTLLWDADLNLLRASLAPALSDIETRAIPSVRMPVVNLKQLLPGMSPDDVTRAVVNALTGHLHAGPATESSELPPGLGDRSENMRGWQWIYGNTPDFRWSWMIDGQEPWVFHVHRGVVDSVEGGDPCLVGQRFGSEYLLAAVKDAARADWLERHPF